MSDCSLVLVPSVTSLMKKHCVAMSAAVGGTMVSKVGEEVTGLAGCDGLLH